MTDDVFERVITQAQEFPRMEVGSSAGEPVLKANKKFMARMWVDGESLLIQCENADEKEFLLGSEPEIYWDTPGIKNSRLLLVRPPVVTDMRLRELLDRAWRRSMPAKPLKEFDAGRANSAAGQPSLAHGCGGKAPEVGADTAPRPKRQASGVLDC